MFDNYDPARKRKSQAASRLRRRRLIGIGVFSLIIIGVFLVGSVAAIDQVSHQFGNCDVIIKIERLDLDDGFQDVYNDPLGIGKRVNPDLELHIEAAVYGHFIGEGSELQGQRIGTSVYTNQQVKPGEAFALDNPLRLQVSKDQFKDSDLLRVQVLIVEIDEVPDVINDAVEGMFDKISIPFAGQLLGDAWGEFGDWLSANDHVGTETILLNSPDKWTDTSIPHPGDAKNIDWIHYTLSEDCSLF